MEHTIPSRRRRTVEVSGVTSVLTLLACAPFVCADEVDNSLIADPAPKITITVDTSEVPELEKWGEEAKALCLLWHDRIRTILRRDKPPVHREIKIIFKKDMKGVAATSRGTISIAADWVKKHPDDYGMVVHELCHVVQAYPRGGPGWLVEGIADNVRYWHYEPGAKDFPINRAKSTYKDAYGTAARFLAWLQAAKNPKIVQKLDAALATGSYKDELFQELAGGDVDELWTEFVTSAAKK